MTKAKQWTHPTGKFPGIIDHDMEFLVGDTLRKACDHVPVQQHMFLLRSVGEVAQEIVTRLKEHGYQKL